MAANTNPIFALTPNIGFGALITTGNNNYDGTNGAVVSIYTAGANGSYVRMVTCEAAGTNIATVARFWINNGSTSGTAANNSLFIQVSLPATTASASAATSHIEIPFNIQLPAGYKIYWVIGTTVAAGWIATAHGGDY